MDYKEKLRRFNATAKYIGELQILNSLCDLKDYEKGLSYGCGLGTDMKFITRHTGCEVYGFDVTEYLYEGDPFYFRTELYFTVHCAYFMHSFAHIQNPVSTLEKLREFGLKKGGRLVIITPNADWLLFQSKKDYTPDPTVVQHYSLEYLKKIVEDAGFKVTMSGDFGEETNGERERIFIKAVS